MKNSVENITIPKKVLRHKKLLAGAKLLYGEIAFICECDGYCKKRNAYFAKLYGTNVGTISRWIKSLTKNKLIKHTLKHKYIRTIFLLTVDNKTIDKVVDRSQGPIDRSTDTLKSIEQQNIALENTSSFENIDNDNPQDIEDDNYFDFTDKDVNEWLDNIGVKENLKSKNNQSQTKG